VRVLPSTTSTNAVIVHGPGTKRQTGAPTAAPDQNAEKRRERGTTRGRQQADALSERRYQRYYTTRNSWRRW
jgi:hypothetical protein